MATVDLNRVALAPGGWRAWRLAARPKTLPVAAAPVLVGAALAWADGLARPGPALAALAGALLLQIGANLANDVFDHERGADGEDRLGPPRAAQLGLLSARQLKQATALVFAAAAGLGLYLVMVGGWPILIVGALALVAGISYSGGPLAFGYRGLGDLAVFVFFGLVAVCGTYWVQAHSLPASTWLASIPLACLATAVLVVNNVRDLASDRRAGKRTLAVILGPRRARLEYGALIATAFLFLLPLGIVRGAPAATLLPMLTLPLAWRLNASVQREQGEPLNRTLADTARLELWFALLLAAGILA